MTMKGWTSLALKAGNVWTISETLEKMAWRKRGSVEPLKNRHYKTSDHGTRGHRRQQYGWNASRKDKNIKAPTDETVLFSIVARRNTPENCEIFTSRIDSVLSFGHRNCIVSSLSGSSVFSRIIACDCEASFHCSVLYFFYFLV